MLVRQVTLENYKNFKLLQLEPQPGLNIVVAANGAGKTNLLEAIYYLAEGSSFRGISEDYVFPLQEPKVNYSAITATTDSESGSATLRLVWQKGQAKTYLLNQKRSSLIGFKRHLAALVHAPTSMDVVAGPAKLRREFLDNAVVKLRPPSKANNQNYLRALRQKNRLLKLFQAGRLGSTATREQLSLWNQQLVTYGVLLTIERINLLTSLRPLLTEMAEQIYRLSSYELDFTITSKYFSREELDSYAVREDQLGYLRKRLAAKLYANLEKELAAGKALYGAHQDDYEFLLNGQSVRYASSRGQQRLFSLILHLATLKLLQSESSRIFVLLLDDIFSELDPVHRRRTLKYLDRLIKRGELQQVFITTPDKRDLPDSKRKTLHYLQIIEK